MAREVDLETFAAASNAGAVVVDVREPEEYGAGHVPGDREVYVICASGNRSQWAADRLTAAGVDAFSVAGGTRGWAGTGRPVVTGTAPGSV